MRTTGAIKTTTTTIITSYLHSSHQSFPLHFQPQLIIHHIRLTRWDNRYLDILMIRRQQDGCDSPAVPFIQWWWVRLMKLQKADRLFISPVWGLFMHPSHSNPANKGGRPNPNKPFPTLYCSLRQTWLRRILVRIRPLLRLLRLKCGCTGGLFAAFRPPQRP